MFEIDELLEPHNEFTCGDGRNIFDSMTPLEPTWFHFKRKLRINAQNIMLQDLKASIDVARASTNLSSATTSISLEAADVKAKLVEITKYMFATARDNFKGRSKLPKVCDF